MEWLVLLKNMSQELNLLLIKPIILEKLNVFSRSITHIKQDLKKKVYRIMTRKIRELKNLELGYQIYLVVIVLLGHLLLFWIPTVHISEHGYFKDPSSPSPVLISDRWDIQFWITGMNVFALGAFFFSMLMLYSYRRSWTKVFNILFTGLVLVWFLASIGFGCYHWVTANESDSYGNPANDLSYCCTYGATVIECPNNLAVGGFIPCPAAITKSAADLSIPVEFYIEFFYRVIFSIFLIIDIILAFFFITYSRYSIEVERGNDTTTTVIVTQRGIDDVEPIESDIGQYHRKNKNNKKNKKNGQFSLSSRKIK